MEEVWSVQSLKKLHQETSPYSRGRTKKILGESDMKIQGFFAGHEQGRQIPISIAP